jgi:hypothetical protein
MWIVYLLKKDGTYIRVDQTDSGDAIQFRRDCYYIGKIRGVHGDVLAGYAHGGEETGSFFAYQFKNNSVQVVVGKEIHPFGADKKLFDKLFRGTPKAAVVDLDIPKQ